MTASSKDLWDNPQQAKTGKKTHTDQPPTVLRTYGKEIPPLDTKELPTALEKGGLLAWRPSHWHPAAADCLHATLFHLWPEWFIKALPSTLGCSSLLMSLKYCCQFQNWAPQKVTLKRSAGDLPLAGFQQMNSGESQLCRLLGGPRDDGLFNYVTTLVSALASYETPHPRQSSPAFDPPQ